ICLVRYPLSLYHISHRFFFYCYGHPRYLHSFPTRRSSDLLLASPTSTTKATCTKMFTSMCARVMPTRALSTDIGTTRTTASGSRSEEHTSELQSRFDLVCRLLLEKKKKKTTLTLQNHCIET